MMTGDSHVSLVNVALTFAIASGTFELTHVSSRDILVLLKSPLPRSINHNEERLLCLKPTGLAIVESPPFLNGEIGRRIGELQVRMIQHLRILNEATDSFPSYSRLDEVVDCSNVERQREKNSVQIECRHFPRQLFAGLPDSRNRS